MSEEQALWTVSAKQHALDFDVAWLGDLYRDLEQWKYDDRQRTNLLRLMGEKIDKMKQFYR